MNKGYYDPENLLKQYEPLIKTLYRQFGAYITDETTRSDLRSQIELEFLKLVTEYQPRRGVDFPFYIKKMLRFRVNHWFTRNLKVVNCEFLREPLSITSILETIPEESINREIEFIEALSSLDEDLVLGKRYRKMMQDILVDKKSLEKIAEEEGVDVKVIRVRLYFLCNKLKDNYHKREKDLER
jgi:RNA polymerase sigma factor (sigma-70 family)